MDLNTLLLHCHVIDDSDPEYTTHEVNAETMLTYKEDDYGCSCRVVELMSIIDQSSDEDDPGKFVVLNLVGEDDAVWLNINNFNADITVWKKQ